MLCPYSKGFSLPRDQSFISCISRIGKRALYHQCQLESLYICVCVYIYIYIYILHVYIYYMCVCCSHIHKEILELQREYC